MNRVELVNGILEKLSGVADPDEDLQLQILNEKHTSNGKRWKFRCSLCQFMHACMLQAQPELGRVTRKFQRARCERF